MEEKVTSDWDTDEAEEAMEEGWARKVVGKEELETLRLPPLDRPNR